MTWAQAAASRGGSRRAATWSPNWAQTPAQRPASRSASRPAARSRASGTTGSIGRPVRGSAGRPKRWDAARRVGPGDWASPGPGVPGLPGLGHAHRQLLLRAPRPGLSQADGRQCARLSRHVVNYALTFSRCQAFVYVRRANGGGTAGTGGADGAGGAGGAADGLGRAATAGGAAAGGVAVAPLAPRTLLGRQRPAAKITMGGLFDVGHAPRLSISCC